MCFSQNGGLWIQWSETLCSGILTPEKTKGDDRKWKDVPKDSEGQVETGSESKKTQTEASGPQNSRLRKFQLQWNAGRPWLQCSENTNSMICSIHYNTGRREECSQSALASKEGCTTFRLETLRKHEESVAHKLAVKENNLTLDKTQTIVVCHSFYSAVQLNTSF